MALMTAPVSLDSPNLRGRESLSLQGRRVFLSILISEIVYGLQPESSSIFKTDRCRFFGSVRAFIPTNMITEPPPACLRRERYRRYHRARHHRRTAPCMLRPASVVQRNRWISPSRPPSPRSPR